MTKKSVVVIGAGISGLACAHRLLELKKQSGLDFEILLLEASSRAGGVIQTECRDGFILEHGPDAFLSEKPAVLNLAKRLGIESEIIGTREEHRKSFVVRGRRLVPVPEGFYLVAPAKWAPFLASPLFSAGGKFRMMLEPFIPPRREGADESVAGFIARRFGKEALERAGQPMLAGIYTGDPRRLSISSSLPRFVALEKKYGSVIRGLRHEALGQNGARGPRYGLFNSFKGGMQTLTDALAAKLPASVLRLNAQILELSHSPVGACFKHAPAFPGWKIVSSAGETFPADVVCLTLPTHVCGTLLGKISPRAAGLLRGIPHESVATLSLAYRSDAIRHPLDGFGFVVPSGEKRSLIACSFTHRKFAGRVPEGFCLVRAFVGGAFGREFFQMPDAELIGRIKADLNELLGLAEEPLFGRLSRYPNSMVQCCPGHAELVARIEADAKKTPGLYLTGAAFRGVGIPDCIEHAESVAEKIGRSLFDNC